MRSMPVFEALEGRTLCSGNVMAVVAGGNLTVIGDALGNGITLTRSGTTVTLTPDAGTSVNRGTAGAAVELLNVTGKITIHTNGGADTVVIAGQVVDGVTQPFAVGGGAADLSVDLGAGDDRLELRGVTARNVTVLTGAGANAVTVTGLDPDGQAGGPADARSVLGGFLKVTGAAGNETVTLEGIDVAGSVTLTLKTGANSATVAPLAGSDANFDVTIGGSFSFDASFARGVNSVSFEDADSAGSVEIAGGVRLLMGLVDDTVTVAPEAELSVGGSFFVNGCYGNDTISLAGMDVKGLLIVNSGYGDDAVTLDSNSVGWAQWVDGDLTIPKYPSFIVPSFLTNAINRYAAGRGSCPDLSGWL